MSNKIKSLFHSGDYIVKRCSTHRVINDISLLYWSFKCGI